jgi:hypothetical protein
MTLAKGQVQKMAFGGGPYRERITTVVAMPTAILRAYATDGFVLAADGLEVDETNKEEKKKDLQKIFSVGKMAAYCMTGITLRGDRREVDRKTISFNFCSQFAEQIRSANVSGFPSLYEYLRHIGTAVNERLIAECRQHEYIHLPDREHIVSVFMDGYHNGKPERVCASFDRKGDVPTVTFEDEGANVGSWRYGSPKIAALVDGDSPFRKQYAFDLPAKSKQKSEDLNSFIRQAWTYIKACSGEEAKRRIDPENCLAVGGRIHIATITKSEGFKLVKGFEADAA